jgi:UPF0755 protein
MKARWHHFYWTALVAAAVWGLWILTDGVRPYFRAREPVLMDIERGAGTREIARRLEEAGIIRSTTTFLVLHYVRPGNTLKAGEYSFEGPASPLEVLDKLIRGEVSYEVLVVPEGYNRLEIASLVEAQGFATKEDFLWASEEVSLIADLDPLAKNLEGYLFPDTYHFPRHARPAQIVQAMVGRFREVYAELNRNEPGRTTHDIVTMASLVEKETSLDAERPVVAAVFYNRLGLGIPLQCDPTVIYALMLENRYDGRILLSQLEHPSPYNTYLHRGLPPGPIANPGRASIAAALQPEQTEYLYFVANAEGGHTFSRTLAEHNVAVSVYRQNLRQAAAAAEATAQ